MGKYIELVQSIEDQLKETNVGFADQIVVFDGEKQTSIQGDLRSLVRYAILDILGSDNHQVIQEYGKVAEDFKQVFVERENNILMFHVERKPKSDEEQKEA